MKYAQGTVNEMGMATFDQAEAAKHPVDSEVYRDLMRTAAGYRDRAKSLASAAGGRARANSYKNAYDAIDARYHRPFAMAELIVTEVAKRLGILQGNENLGDLRSSPVDQRESDFGRLHGLFAEMWSSTDPDIVMLRGYLDSNGLGGLTYNQYATLAQGEATGWKQKADLARANGDYTTAEKADANWMDAQDAAWFINDSEEWDRYDQLRTDWEDHVVNNPSMPPWSASG